MRAQAVVRTEHADAPGHVRMKPALVALLSLVMGSARAEPLPGWLEGTWIGQGVLQLSEWNALGNAENDKLLKASRLFALKLDGEGFTISPLWLSDYISGDDLTATPGSSPLRDDDSNLAPPYVSLGGVPEVDPGADMPYVILSPQRCITNRDHDLPLSDDGHLTPPERSSQCDPVKLFRLAEDRMLWPSPFGWIVMDRRHGNGDRIRHSGQEVAPPARAP